MYEKRINYIDMLVDGEKKGIVGYVRYEKNEKNKKLWISLKDIPVVYDGEYDIYILINEIKQAIGKITLSKGSGTVLLDSNNNTIIKQIEYEDIKGIEIALDENRILSTYIHNEINDKNIEATKSNDHEINIDIIDRNKSDISTRDSGEINRNNEKINVDKIGDKKIRDDKINTQEMDNEKRGGVGSSQGNLNNQIKFHNNKWDQLLEIYPHINPFNDEREFLSIRPSDFVIFNEKYYWLIKNSFLLHGYYNYGHMILKRVRNKGENKYYVGVPGTYFDREKQVAVMFGFENFESKNDSAAYGEYGYYLIRTEL